MIKNIALFLVFCFMLRPETAHCFSNVEEIGIERFLELVDANHPEKSIDEHVLNRSIEAQRKAGVLSDPEFSFGREQVPTGEDMNMFMWKVSVTQPIPWPGVLKKETEIYKERTNIVAINKSFSALQRRLVAKELYLSLVVSSKLIEIEKANLGETLNILKISDERLKYAIGSHHEFIQAQNEKIILSLNIQALESDLENNKDRAAQEIGREDASNLSFNLNQPVEQITQSMTIAAGDDLTKKVLESSQNETFAQLDLERKQSLPNFMVSGMAMRMDSGMKMYGFMAGIRVPLYSGGIRKGLSAERSLSSQKTTEELAWHDTKKRRALVQNSRRKTVLENNIQALRNEIIPNSEEHLKFIIIEYAQGKANFASVNIARKLLFKYQGAQVQAERDLAFVTIAKERILAGIIDADMSEPAPQLPSFDVVSGMDTTTGMSGMNKSAPMKKSPVMQKRTIPSTTPEEEEGTKKEKSGMGGM